MDVIFSPFEETYVFQKQRFQDQRGSLIELYRNEEMVPFLDSNRFVQDLFTVSKCGVLRGLHFQLDQPQGKLISVVHGKIFDVFVDIRIDSTSFGKWHGIELSDENALQVYLPPGFAHGFLTLSNSASVNYKLTNYYDPNDQNTLIWNDKTISIDWPRTKNLSISEKDLQGISFENLREIINK